MELPDVDHFSYAGDVDQVLDEIEQFVTGLAPSAAPRIRRHQVQVTNLGRFSVPGSIVELDLVRDAATLTWRLERATSWPLCLRGGLDLCV